MAPMETVHEGIRLLHQVVGMLVPRSPENLTARPLPSPRRRLLGVRATSRRVLTQTTRSITMSTQGSSESLTESSSSISSDECSYLADSPLASSCDESSRSPSTSPTSTNSLYRVTRDSFSMNDVASRVNPIHKSDPKQSTSLQDDLDKIRKNLKTRKSKSCLSWKLSVSDQTDCESPQRTLCIEKDKMHKTKKGKNAEKDSLFHEEGGDHDFSTSLVLTVLEQGYFNAELSTRKLPAGDIKIKVRDYQLEIYVYDAKTQEDNTRSSKSRSKKEASVKYCGRVAIPIYVAPETLTVNLDDDRDLLHLRAMMKGYQYQRTTSDSDVDGTSSRDASSRSSIMTSKTKIGSLAKILLRNRRFTISRGGSGQMRDRAYTQ